MRSVQVECHRRVQAFTPPQLVSVLFQAMEYFSSYVVVDRAVINMCG